MSVRAIPPRRGIEAVEVDARRREKPFALALVLGLARAHVPGELGNRRREAGA
jgi:hypothetical protein